VHWRQKKKTRKKTLKKTKRSPQNKHLGKEAKVTKKTHDNQEPLGYALRVKMDHLNAFLETSHLTQHKH